MESMNAHSVTACELRASGATTIQPARFTSLRPWYWTPLAASPPSQCQLNQTGALVGSSGSFRMNFRFAPALSKLLSPLANSGHSPPE